MRFLLCGNPIVVPWIVKEFFECWMPVCWLRFVFRCAQHWRFYSAFRDNQVGCNIITVPSLCQWFDLAAVAPDRLAVRIVRHKSCGAVIPRPGDGERTNTWRHYGVDWFWLSDNHNVSLLAYHFNTTWIFSRYWARQSIVPMSVQIELLITKVFKLTLLQSIYAQTMTTTPSIMRVIIVVPTSSKTLFGSCRDGYPNNQEPCRVTWGGHGKLTCEASRPSEPLKRVIDLIWRKSVGSVTHRFHIIQVRECLFNIAVQWKNVWRLLHDAQENFSRRCSLWTIGVHENDRKR